MYAVIKSGGKQYRVKAGQTVRLEKLAGEDGSKVELGDVMMVEDGGNVQTGSRCCQCEGRSHHSRDRSRRENYCLQEEAEEAVPPDNGHRQGFTAVRIEKISV